MACSPAHACVLRCAALRPPDSRSSPMHRRHQPHLRLCPAAFASVRTDARAPLPLNGTLAFCGDAGASCCDAADDTALRDQLQAANVSDAACAAVFKSLLCARCNPYFAELFDAGPKIHILLSCLVRSRALAGRRRHRSPPPRLPRGCASCHDHLYCKTVVTDLQCDRCIASNLFGSLILQ